MGILPRMHKKEKKNIRLSKKAAACSACLKVFDKLRNMSCLFPGPNKRTCLPLLAESKPLKSPYLFFWGRNALRFADAGTFPQLLPLPLSFWPSSITGSSVGSAKESSSSSSGNQKE